MIPPTFAFDRDDFIARNIGRPFFVPRSWTELYVMQCGPFTKIGISGSAAARVAALQLTNPMPVTLVRTYRMQDRHYAFVAEQEAHRVFAAARGFGEWFDVDPAIAVPIVRQIAAAARHLRSLHRQAHPRDYLMAGGLS
jgi:hypothetical protein